jgi:hypothetical protein
MLDALCGGIRDALPGGAGVPRSLPRVKASSII